MRRTTVYLSDEEASALRKAAARSGISQAQLIREGLKSVLGPAPKKTFHSMGKGESRGTQNRSPRWTEGEVYRKALGK